LFFITLECLFALAFDPLDEAEKLLAAFVPTPTGVLFITLLPVALEVPYLADDSLFKWRPDKMPSSQSFSAFSSSYCLKSSRAFSAFFISTSRSSSSIIKYG
jgi:hypothetical protein